MDGNYKTALIHHRHQLYNSPGSGYLQLPLLLHLLILMFPFGAYSFPVLIMAPMFHFHLFLQLRDRSFMKWQMMSILNHSHYQPNKKTWPSIFVMRLNLVITVDLVITL